MMSEQKRLLRSTGDRVIGGVAAGVARYLEVDPLFVRAGFFVLALLQGVGLIVYGILWLLVPDETTQHLSSEQVMKANIEDMKAQVHRIGGSMREGSQVPKILGLL